MKYHSVFVHGNAAKVENPENCNSINSYGWGTDIILKNNGPGEYDGTWIHIPLTANLPVADHKLTYLLSVEILFYSENCGLDRVDIYDGSTLIYSPTDTQERISLSGEWRFKKDDTIDGVETQEGKTHAHYNQNWNTYILKKAHPVFCGIGISVFLHSIFPSNPNWDSTGGFITRVIIASACANYKVKKLSKIATKNR